MQITGVVNTTMHEPVRFAHVYNLSRGNGTYTDENGIYSIVTRLNDSLSFSCIGFKNQRIHVDKLESIKNEYNIVFESDTIYIDELVIFPWATYEDFKRAFLATNVISKEDEYLKKNLEITMRSIYREFSVPSANISYRAAMENIQARQFGREIIPSLSLLNPIAWAQFFEAIRNGSLSFRNPEKRYSNDN